MSPSPILRCRSHRRAMLDLIDGVESARERERLMAHADACVRCSTELTRALELRRRIDSAEEPELSAASEAAFIEQVMVGIDAADGQRLHLDPAHVRRPRPATRLIGGAAFVAAAAMAAFLRYPQAEEVLELTPSPAAEASMDVVETERPAPIAAPLELGISTESIDRADFVRLLEVAAVAQPFDPKLDLESDAWVAALKAAASREGVLPGTLTRGARRLLQRDPESPFAPLAARFLGRRADLRDRSLLLDSLPQTRAAGALALCERGDAGVKLLWKAASKEPLDAAAAAVQMSIEQALTQWSAARDGELTGDLDLSLNVPLASTLLAQSGRRAARRLLEQYLRDGDPRWLDPWRAASQNTADLSDLFEEASWGPRDLRSQRLLTAMEHAAFAPGLDFAIEALSGGAVTAAAALVALPGEEPLVALMNAARAGRLRADAEDLAWSLFAQERSEDIVAFAKGRGTNAAERTAFVLPRLAIVVSSTPAARWTLLELGLSPELSTDDRVRALLLAVDADSNEEEAVDVERGGRPFGPRLRALTESPEAALSAAAWIALWHLGDEHVINESPLAQTLARSGTVAVQHLRVVRELRRARATGGRSL